MKDFSKETLSSEFNKQLYLSLLKNIPPKKITPHLEDIVNLLMEAFEEGELKIEFDQKIYLSDRLNCTDWPNGHIKALLESGWLEGLNAPIKMTENQLSWAKWDYNMQEAINKLIKRSTVKKSLLSTSKRIHDIRIDNNLNQKQRKAVEAILKSQIILISGGPGTGKTSILKNILDLALFLNPKLRIGMAASTGKATRRLKESIETSQPKRQSNFSNIPCKTLHSWLKATPHGFGFDKNNLIPLDLLIIDEMSMVDLELMQGLLNAYPENSQLVLVGDPEQLPPINSGAIWHKLQEEQTIRKFNEGAVHLDEIYRNQGELARLSSVLRDKGLNSFWQELNNIPKISNFDRHSYEFNEIPDFVISAIERQLKKLREIAMSLTDELSDDLSTNELKEKKEIVLAESLIKQIDEIMVLSPKRQGVWGVNQIHKALLKNFLYESIEKWPNGTPIICGENQPDLGLSNGDIGILIGKSNYKKVVFKTFLEGRTPSYQLIHPVRLKKVEPALALTIHKAQGSEANQVILLWPNQEVPSRKNTYEKKLLYTAITRAKGKVMFISR